MIRSWKKVAIFGGAFNPPTVGHIEVARAVLGHKELGLDEVWLTPCSIHRYGKEMAPFNDRDEMCARAAIESGERRIKVSNWEDQARQLVRHYDGSTYDFWASHIPETRIAFHFVIGMDNALGFHNWKNYEALQRKARFIVIPRPGYQHDPEAWYMKVPEQPDPMFVYLEEIRHHYLADVLTPDTSSSQIRNVLKEWGRTGDPPEILRAGLDPKVLKYIVDHNLYTQEPHANDLSVGIV
jgi:nicotinate-nucleotide adenylyltransferase